jgi:hypothetical protein
MHPAPVRAHGGPPFVVVPEQRLGPYTVTAWDDPDVGSGLFLIEATLDGVPPPANTDVTVTVQPEDLHCAAATFIAERQQRLFGGEQFVLGVTFDTEGPWHVRLAVEGPAGRGETMFVAQVTPNSPGWFASLICLVPFVGLGGLWLCGIRRNRQMERTAPNLVQ